MSDEILKFRIEGDTSKMVEAYKDAKKELAKLEKATVSTQKKIDSARESTKLYKDQIENLTKAYNDGKISQDRFEKQLAKVTKQEARSTNETKKLERELSNLEKKQKGLNNILPKYEEEMKKVNKSTANALPVTQEFSRVIQDAPFGIIGVGNNLTRLAETFTNLKNSSGGALPALKAVGQSFLGSGGLLFLFSTAISLLTIYSDKLKISSSLSEELAKATKEGIASAQNEITSLKSLLSVANDETKSKKARLLALDRINEKYGDYLGNLKLEELGTTRVKTAVDNLTRSLIKQAQVKGAQNLIEEKSKDTAEDLAKALSNQTQRSIQLQDEIKRLGKDYVELSKINYSQPLNKQVIEATKIINERLGGKKGGVGDTLKFLTDGFNEAGEEVKSLQKKTEESLAPLQQLINQLTFEDILLETKGEGKGNVDLEVTVTPEEQAKRDAKIMKIREDIQKELDKISAELDLVNLEDAAILGKEVENIYVQSGAAAAEAVRNASEEKFDFGAFEAEQKIISLEKRLKDLKAVVDDQTFNILQGLDLEQLTAFENKMKEVAESGQLFAELSTNAIQSVTGAVANSIKTESEIVNSFLSSILQTFGKYLSELAANAIKNIAIKQAESTANAVAAGTASASAAGPAAAYVLPALIAGAVGAVFAAFGGIKFAQGGIVPGGGTGDRVPALLTPGEVVFNRGQQARLLAMAEGNVSQGINSNGTGTLVAEGVLRGDDVYLMVKRSERKDKRFNG